MSFIIKGVNLPKKGKHILALIKDNGACYYFERDSRTAIAKPMENAEAIQIPKDHGNIVDESKAIVTETIDGYYEITAPVILEAESEGEK